jgi:hypothetical protein
MTTDRRFQTIFKEKSLSEFLWEVCKDYPSFGRSVVTACYHLYQHTCARKAFSNMALIKIRQKMPAAGTRL